VFCFGQLLKKTTQAISKFQLRSFVVFSCILACPGALQRNDSLFFVSSFAVLFLSVSCTFPSLCLVLVPWNGKSGRAGLLLSGGSPVAFSFAFACPGGLQRKHTLKGRLLAGCWPAAGRRHRHCLRGVRGVSPLEKKRQTKDKQKSSPRKDKRKSNESQFQRNSLVCLSFSLVLPLFFYSFPFLSFSSSFPFRSFSFLFLVFSFTVTTQKDRFAHPSVVVTAFPPDVN
jgi:hypothetical protein